MSCPPPEVGHPVRQPAPEPAAPAQLHAVGAPVPAPGRRRPDAPGSTSTAGAPGPDWLLAMQDLVAEVSAVEAAVAAGSAGLPVGRHEAAPAAAPHGTLTTTGPADRAVPGRERSRQPARRTSVPLPSDLALLSHGEEQPPARPRPQGKDLALALLALAVLVAVALVLTGSPS